LTFTPESVGPASDNLSIPSNVPASPTLVPLSGTGTQAALSISPSPVTFPAQVVYTSSTPIVLTVTNTGLANLMLTAAVVATGDVGEFSIVPTPLAPNQPQTDCIILNTPLPPQATCTIAVLFAPTADGERTATATISSNAAGSPQTLTLTGLGIGGVGPASGKGGSGSTGSGGASNISGTNTVTSGGAMGWPDLLLLGVFGLWAWRRKQGSIRH